MLVICPRMKSRLVREIQPWRYLRFIFWTTQASSRWMLQTYIQSQNRSLLRYLSLGGSGVRITHGASLSRRLTIIRRLHDAQPTVNTDPVMLPGIVRLDSSQDSVPAFHSKPSPSHATSIPRLSSHSDSSFAPTHLSSVFSDLFTCYLPYLWHLRRVSRSFRKKMFKTVLLVIAALFVPICPLPTTSLGKISPLSHLWGWTLIVASDKWPAEPKQPKRITYEFFWIDQDRW